MNNVTTFSRSYKSRLKRSSRQASLSFGMNGFRPPKLLKLRFHQSTHIALQIHSSSFQPSRKAAPLASLECGQLLQSLTASKAYRKALRLHGHMITSGVLAHNTYLKTKLCAMYALFGDMPEARVLFDGIVLKSSFLWNVMIRGYACNGSSVDSLVLYRQMFRFGKKADNFTYPYVLMACGDLSLNDIGQRIHGELAVCGFGAHVCVGNSLLSMYSKFGDMRLARKLFDNMRQRDLTSWNTVISGYVKNGDPVMALSTLSSMSLSGIGIDHATLVSVLPAAADLSALEQAKEIHAYILRSGFEFEGFLMNALIDVYMNSNFIMGARRLFEGMSTRDTVTWNSMISGCARHGDPVESLNLFQQMNLESIIPDVVTLVAVLGACDRISALHVGRSIHACANKMGFFKEVTVGTALIDMYAKCGSLGCSRGAFDEIESKNLISWSAMVSGYGIHGRGREAIACFSEMKEKGLRPDRVSFTSVLSACSHSGLVNEGRELFFQMSNQYSVSPTMEHYSCMVDLLGRAGHLDEAYQVIRNMEVKPNADVWAALLSACSVHRNVELAEIAAENAFHLRPKGIGPYVSLSNFYAMQKRWSDAHGVRTTARRNGLRKPPGCSFVELDMTIHRFMVGDKSHPQSSSIYAKLNALRQQLKDAGYKPDTSCVFYDIKEDGKEELLWDHSERLALAFALLNTSPWMTIRITKNLRVCSDCHTVTKLISKLVHREIVVRDAHRFHHFQDGCCSCGDYW